jgi:hypothetical protein
MMVLSVEEGGESSILRWSGEEESTARSRVEDEEEAEESSCCGAARRGSRRMRLTGSGEREPGSFHATMVDDRLDVAIAERWASN